MVVVVVVASVESADETTGVPMAIVTTIARAAAVRAGKPFMSKPFNGILKSVLTHSLKIL